MPRKRKYTNDDLENAVKNSISYAEVLRKIGLKESGGSYKHIRGIIESLKIDTGHFLGQAYLIKKKRKDLPKKPLSEILVKDSSYGRCHLKKRLIEEGLLKYKCYNCGISKWQQKPLSLHLEHKNGVNNDNRIENLELLCPNCHSQTATYSGKNTKGKKHKNRKKEIFCSKCRCQITRYSKSGFCSKCVRLIKKKERL